jgi:hypothetical protein
LRQTGRTAFNLRHNDLANDRVSSACALTERLRALIIGTNLSTKSVFWDAPRLAL